jgi:hypothetical protein
VQVRQGDFFILKHGLIMSTLFFAAALLSASVKPGHLDEITT